jgi:hypothetical protein
MHSLNWILVQVFPSLWCWVWLVLVLRVLDFHLSWCEATVVRFDAVVWAWVGMVEMVGIRQVMWLVMLESAKDRILGVDAPEQHVPPHVRYGTACWIYCCTQEHVLLVAQITGLSVSLWESVGCNGGELSVFTPTHGNMMGFGFKCVTPWTLAS